MARAVATRTLQEFLHGGIEWCLDNRSKPAIQPDEQVLNYCTDDLLGALWGQLPSPLVPIAPLLIRLCGFLWVNYTQPVHRAVCGKLAIGCLLEMVQRVALVLYRR